MERTLSPTDLDVILGEADVAARRLARRLRLSTDDIADIRQDLLTDLLARIRAFEPDRGSLGAFAGTIIANRATRIAGQVRKHRSLFGEYPVSLDEPVPGADGLNRADCVAEDEGLASMLGHSECEAHVIERRLDVERGIGLLDADAAALCAGLRTRTPHELAESGRYGSRSALYRRLRDIRLTFTMAGLRLVWDGSAGA